MNPPVLNYRRSTRTPPTWLKAYSYFVFGLTVLSVAILVYAFFSGDDSWRIAFALASPVLVMISSCQYRGVFKRQSKFAQGGGALQVACGFALLYASVVTIAEGIKSSDPPDGGFFLTFAIVGLLGFIPLVAGALTFRYGSRVWQDEVADS